MRKILFLFPPEFIHDAVVLLLRIPFVGKIVGLLYKYEHSSLQQDIMGITFPNPVGLAAGFDKNAQVFRQCGDLGFGFVEIGTVTPVGQPGNPKPRLFRVPADKALINRMGFNNKGVEAVLKRLMKRQPGLVIAGNIGKNKMTPNASAASDYETCIEVLYPYVDFFVVNVSSPNTPHLRELQEKEHLLDLISRLQKLKLAKIPSRPLLLKISPDLNNHQLDDIIEIVQRSGIDGIVATNTTIGRENLKTKLEKIRGIGEGGLSGKPLTRRALEVVRYLHEKSEGAFPIIGVGGIHSIPDCLEMFRAGASLVELYTGFIYEGPGLIKKIKKAIVEKNLLS